MNSKLIEDVARAICIEQGFEPDKVYSSNRFKSGSGGAEIALAVPAWHWYCDVAVCAINVVRDHLSTARAS